MAALPLKGNIRGKRTATVLFSALSRVFFGNFFEFSPHLFLAFSTSSPMGWGSWFGLRV
jgi:hypothetical protein